MRAAGQLEGVLHSVALRCGGKHTIACKIGAFVGEFFAHGHGLAFLALTKYAVPSSMGATLKAAKNWTHPEADAAVHRLPQEMRQASLSHPKSLHLPRF